MGDVLSFVGGYLASLAILLNLLLFDCNCKVGIIRQHYSLLWVYSVCALCRDGLGLLLKCAELIEEHDFAIHNNVIGDQSYCVITKCQFHLL
jgi:hypothetical protein